MIRFEIRNGKYFRPPEVRAIDLKTKLQIEPQDVARMIRDSLNLLPNYTAMLVED